MVDVERLLAEEDAAWRALHEVFSSIPADRFDEPGVTPDGWSAKDLMFHVGAWCAQCGTVLERIRMGTFSPSGDEEDPLDERNRRWFDTSRRLDVPTVQVEFHAARTRMLQEWQALDEITPAAWEWFEESGPLHYAEHLRDLRSWLAAGS
jgi:hypothetical protein